MVYAEPVGYNIPALDNKNLNFILKNRGKKTDKLPANKLPLPYTTLPRAPNQPNELQYVEQINLTIADTPYSSYQHNKDVKCYSKKISSGNTCPARLNASDKVLGCDLTVSS